MSANAGLTVFTSHGGRGNEGRIQLDGLSVSGAVQAGAVFYQTDISGAQEIQATLSGALGEAETGGITLNVVPKTGGNRFAGQFFASAAGEWAQADNIDDNLRALNITQTGLIKNWDINGSAGGPIKRDRLSPSARA